MFALLAIVCFAVEFVLHLVGAGSGKVALVPLGLAFLAAHWVLGSLGTGGSWPWHRRE